MKTNALFVIILLLFTACADQPQILINERVGNDFGDYDIPGDNVIPVDPGEKTKPWKTNHEGPTKIEIHGTTRRQLDGFKAEFSPEDFWFTARDNNIYAIALEVSESRQIMIRNMRGTDADEIESVGILGSNEKPGWELCSEGLQIRLPETLPSTLGYAIAISKKTRVLRNMIIKGI